MIDDSCPWKYELWQRAASLRKRMSQQRWRESSIANVEKEIFVSAYVIRKLMEAEKLSDEVESCAVRGWAHAPSGRAVDIGNCHRIDKLYDLSSRLGISLSLREYCNQVVHSYIFQICLNVENRGLAGFFIASDREKERRLLYFDLDQIIINLERVAEDDIVYIYRERQAMGMPLKTVAKSNRHPEDPLVSPITDPL